MAEPTLLQQARERLLNARVDGMGPEGFHALIGAVDYTLQLLESWVAKALPSQPMSIGYERDVPRESPPTYSFTAPPGTVQMREMRLAPGETVKMFDGLYEKGVINGGRVALLVNLVADTARVEPPRIPDDDLTAIEKLCAAATPEPWEYAEEASAVLFGEGTHGGIVCEFPDPAADASERDAEFIAAAREHMPKLIAEARRLRVEGAEFKRQAEQYHAMYDRLYMAGGIDPELADETTLALIALLQSGEPIVPATRAMLTVSLKRLLRLMAQGEPVEPDHG